MRKKKVLVIDDDEMNLQIAKMILERKLPCEVIGVDNGIEGLEVLRQQHVSLVLLDIMMPDFDGIETLQEIRKDARIKDVPIIMLTASSDVENIQKVGLLGVTDYIKKFWNFTFRRRRRNFAGNAHCNRRKFPARSFNRNFNSKGAKDFERDGNRFDNR